MPELSTMAAPEVVATLSTAIAEAGGAEVYFRGIVDENLALVRVEAIARGTEDAVAAGMPIRPPWNIVLHNHPGGNLAPSEADLDLSAWLSGQEVAFLIIDNEAFNYAQIVAPVVARQDKPVDPDAIRALFAHTGPIAGLVPGYEERTSQREMAAQVATICNEGLHGIIEAPTGTGKSLAYLVPLVSWAILNDKRVLVATHTINLQHQLFEKDIPFVRRILGEEFRAVLVKGRGNYICRRRFEEGISGAGQDLFPPQDLAQLEGLAGWIETTTTGDRAELASMADDIWDRVASDSDLCAGPRCQLFAECFFRKARRQAVEARVLVTNHALFFTDMAMQRDKAGSGVLPPSDRIVIDEAHNIEDVATDCFGVEAAAHLVARQLGRIARRGARPTGLLVQFSHLLSALGAQGEEAAQDVSNRVIPLVHDAYRELDPGFAALYECFAREGGPPSGFTERILPGDTATRERIAPLLTKISGPLALAAAEILKSVGDVSRMQRDERDEQDEDSRALESVCLQLNQLAERLQGYAGVLDDFAGLGREDMVYWVEGRLFRERQRLILHRSPLSVRGILTETLFAKCRGVCYTSATLAGASGSFAFFESRVGLDGIDRKLRRAWQLPTVFDYKSRVLLALPDGFPEKPDAEFPRQFAEFASGFVRASRGRVFFLFTSWKMLLACHEATMALLPEEWQSTCLRQGDLDRHHLLESFRTIPNAILFGTSSFWEGVDVKGDRLVAVVIVRLPFQVPDDPMVRARTIEIENEGRSAFFEYSLPHAVIRFRQGVGRLMRTKQDYGTIVVLDPRVKTKKYGQTFTRALPETARTEAGGEALFAEIRAFLARFE